MNPRDYFRFIDMDPVDYTNELLAQLNQSAKTHGFKDFAGLQRKLEHEGPTLDHEAKYQLLKQLAPLQYEAEHMRKQLPPTDCTGLTRLDDVIHTIVRIIIILLFGYDQEQLQELADRMKAERAIEIDNAFNQKRKKSLHSSKVQQLAAFAQRLAQPVPSP